MIFFNLWTIHGHVSYYTERTAHDIYFVIFQVILVALKFAK
jgi:hypothetical protein